MNNNFQDGNLIKCSLTQIGDKFIETCENGQMCRMVNNFLECDGYNNDIFYATIHDNDNERYTNANSLQTQSGNGIIDNSPSVNLAHNENKNKNKNNIWMWIIIIGIIVLLIIIIGTSTYYSNRRDTVEALLGGCGCTTPSRGGDGFFLENSSLRTSDILSSIASPKF